MYQLYKYFNNPHFIPNVFVFYFNVLQIFENLTQGNFSHQINLCYIFDHFIFKILKALYFKKNHLILLK